jgi:hypothetical protein
MVALKLQKDKMTDHLKKEGNFRTRQPEEAVKLMPHHSNRDTGMNMRRIGHVNISWLSTFIKDIKQKPVEL